jgi:hypothetical protein
VAAETVSKDDTLILGSAHPPTPQQKPHKELGKEGCSHFPSGRLHLFKEDLAACTCLLLSFETVCVKENSRGVFVVVLFLFLQGLGKIDNG